MLRIHIWLLLTIVPFLGMTQRMSKIGNNLGTKSKVKNESLARFYNAAAVVEVTPVRNQFPVPVTYKVFRFSNLKKTEVKGVVLLSDYAATLSFPLLVKIAQSLANENCIVAIIQHRGNQGKDFGQQAAKVEEDYRNVWDHLSAKYGGTLDKTIVGGISFSGFALAYSISQPAAGWLRQIKGVALIGAGISPYTTVPVINKVCDNDTEVNSFGNKGGNELQIELNTINPTLAAKSSCETDPVCTGHDTSDTWAQFFIDKIRAWLQ